MISRAYLLLAVGVPFFAQVPPNGAASTGSLSGRVVNSVTGEPVSKVRVDLQPRMVQGMLPQVLNATTDTSGRFTISQLPAGRYVVRAMHQNYPEQRQQLSTQQSVEAVVENGTSNKDLTISLTPGGAISGKVTGADGEPLRCSVNLLEMNLDSMNQGLVPSRSANTDDRGEFRLFGIPAGRYYLQAQSQGQIPQAHPLMTQEEMMRQPGLSYVSLFYPNSRSEQGAAKIVVEPGAEVQGIEMRMTPVRTVSVSGKVQLPVDVGTPPQGIYVRLISLRADGSSDSTSHLGGSGIRPGTNSFVLPNVPAGSYLLDAGSQSQDRTYFGTQSMNVGEEPVTDLTIAMKASFDLQVTIVQESVPAAQQSGQFTRVQGGGGFPRSGQRSPLWFNPMSGFRNYSMPQIDAQSDTNLTLRKVLPGIFDVVAQNGYVKRMRLGNREITGSTLEITDADTGPLEVTVSNQYSQVRGSVEGVTRGQNAMVLLINKNAMPNSMNAMQIAGIDPSNGQFQTSLVPGEYKALSIDGVEPHRLRNPLLKDWIAKQSTDVKIESGGTTAQSITVPFIPRDAIEKAFREAIEKQ